MVYELQEAMDDIIYFALRLHHIIYNLPVIMTRQLNKRLCLKRHRYHIRSNILFLESSTEVARVPSSKARNLLFERYIFFPHIPVPSKYPTPPPNTQQNDQTHDLTAAKKSPKTKEKSRNKKDPRGTIA